MLALASAGATNLLLVTLLIAVSASLLGSLTPGEALELIPLIGIALIGISLPAIDDRLWRRGTMPQPIPANPSRR